ncbi:MAG: hypothetical protein ACREXG_00915 [Polaromonas sp.]
MTTGTTKRRRAGQQVADVPSPRGQKTGPRLLKAGTPKKAAAKTSILATEKARAVGRPTKFDPLFCQQVAKLCRLGATDKEIADFFVISTATLDRWKNEHPEFLSSIKASKLFADAHVADALYRRALGYSHAEMDIRTVALGGNAGSEIVQTPTTKHFPPDTTAAIFWLKNRQPAAWRDRVEMAVTNDLMPDKAKLLEMAVIMDAAREREVAMLAERRALGYLGD